MGCTIQLVCVALHFCQMCQNLFSMQNYQWICSYCQNVYPVSYVIVYTNQHCFIQYRLFDVYPRYFFYHTHSTEWSFTNSVVITRKRCSCFNISIWFICKWIIVLQSFILLFFKLIFEHFKLCHNPFIFIFSERAIRRIQIRLAFYFWIITIIFILK